jgi:hypothetical protein
MRIAYIRCTIFEAIGFAGLLLAGVLAFSFHTAQAQQMSNYVCVHHSIGCPTLVDCPGDPGPTDTYCNVSGGGGSASGNCMSVPGQVCTGGYDNCDIFPAYYCLTETPVLMDGQQVYCTSMFFPICQ